MKMVNGSLLVALGLVVLYLAVTGKLERFAQAWRVIKGEKGDDYTPPVDPRTPGAPSTVKPDATGAGRFRPLSVVDSLALPPLPDLTFPGRN